MPDNHIPFRVAWDVDPNRTEPGVAVIRPYEDGTQANVTGIFAGGPVQQLIKQIRTQDAVGATHVAPFENPEKQKEVLEAFRAIGLQPETTWEP